jgi:hypothetical protein
VLIYLRSDTKRNLYFRAWSRAGTESYHVTSELAMSTSVNQRSHYFIIQIYDTATSYALFNTYIAESITSEPKLTFNVDVIICNSINK